ncbi:preprotein translocase subunit SecA, partial [candidate division NPL-UPA2 bacterium]|nr:preprotein translocase subunit SecA [candidate division NPL-UPA2 bacterium]
MANLLTKIFKTKNERELRRLQTTVDEINALEPTISALSDGELRAKTEEFRQRIQEKSKALSGELETLRQEMGKASSDEEKTRIKEKIKRSQNRILDPVLPEAFAVAREAAKRTVGMRPFDVQLM